MTIPLTERQKAFAEIYKHGSLSGADAAQLAGYKPSTAANMASILKRDPRIRAILEAPEQPSNAS